MAFLSLGDPEMVECAHPSWQLVADRHRDLRASADAARRLRAAGDAGVRRGRPLESLQAAVGWLLVDIGLRLAVRRQSGPDLRHPAP